MELDPTLIVITDSDLLLRGSSISMVDAVRAAAAGGATIIQLREKKMCGVALLQMADELLEALVGTGCAFMVNDRLDIALASGADGVHLGQEDLPLSRAKQVAGSRLVFGVSAGMPEWVVQAASDGADYIGVGPIYPTATKENARTPIGPEGLADLVKLAPEIPAVGIGGIDADNLGPVIHAGAAGVAVVSAVFGAPNIEAATREIRNRIEKARG